MKLSICVFTRGAHLWINLILVKYDFKILKDSSSYIKLNEIIILVLSSEDDITLYLRIQPFHAHTHARTHNIC